MATMKFTVRKGFRYYLVNANGTMLDKKRFIAEGGTIDLDPKSKAFLGQKSKFVEWPFRLKDETEKEVEKVEDKDQKEDEDVFEIPENLENVVFTKISVPNLKKWLDSICLSYGDRDSKGTLISYIEDFYKSDK